MLPSSQSPGNVEEWTRQFTIVFACASLDVNSGNCRSLLELVGRFLSHTTLFNLLLRHFVRLIPTSIKAATLPLPRLFKLFISPRREEVLSCRTWRRTQKRIKQAKGDFVREFNLVVITRRSSDYSVYSSTNSALQY